MVECLDEFDIENLTISLEVYESEVAKMVKDPDPATSELASVMIEDIKKVKAKLPKLSCGVLPYEVKP